MYYQIHEKMVREYGLEVAFLYAVIENIGRVRPKDNQGYFSIYSKTLMERTGWGRDKLCRYRSKLAKSGLVAIIPGKNQNVRFKYKLTKK